MNELDNMDMTPQDNFYIICSPYWGEYNKSFNISMHKDCPASKVKIKVSPLQTMKAHGVCGCKGQHIYTATALGRGTVSSFTLGRLYPRGKPRYSFHRRLSEPQDQSGPEGVKKNPTSDTRERTRAVQPISKCLDAWATWPTCPAPTSNELYSYQYLQWKFCIQIYGGQSCCNPWFYFI